METHVDTKVSAVDALATLTGIDKIFNVIAKPFHIDSLTHVPWTQ